MRTIVIALMLLIFVPVVCLAADDPAETACHQKETTIAIMDCLGGLTAQWDKRLNAAYKVAMTASESDGRQADLLQAERAWLKYRTANCGWYDAQQGTIREVEGAGCMLDMTRARSLELEEALKP